LVPYNIRTGITDPGDNTGTFIHIMSISGEKKDSVESHKVQMYKRARTRGLEFGNSKFCDIKAQTRN